MTTETTTIPLTRRVPFNPAFRDANRTRARYRVLMGGAGSGKSRNLAQDYVIKLSDPRYAGANLLVCRRADETNRYSTFAELCAAVRTVFGESWQEFWKISQSPLRLQSLVTGNEIIFRGMIDASAQERVKSVAFASGKLCWIWCEEATELTSENLELLDDRLRGALPNGELFYQITLSFNPVSAHHWLKRRFFDEPRESAFLCRTTFRDNRFIDADFTRRMEERRARDPEGYRVYGEGEWGESGGLILSNFVREPFERDPARFDAMALGQDFGFNHANAILRLGLRDDELYILDEIYERGKDTGDLIALARARGLPAAVRMWCDSAEPDRIRTWKRAGFRAVPVAKEPGCIHAQIDWLRRRRIHVHPDCENTWREITFTLQQTSAAHKWLKNACRALLSGDTSDWAAFSGLLENPVTGDSIAFSNACIKKLPDESFQQTGQTVSWTLLCGGIEG